MQYVYLELKQGYKLSDRVEAFCYCQKKKVVDIIRHRMPLEEYNWRTAVFSRTRTDIELEKQDISVDASICANFIEEESQEVFVRTALLWRIARRTGTYAMPMYKYHATG